MELPENELPVAQFTFAVRQYYYTKIRKILYLKKYQLYSVYNKIRHNIHIFIKL